MGYPHLVKLHSVLLAAAVNPSGLAISSDDGVPFANSITIKALGSDFIAGVFATSSNVDAFTCGGLSMAALTPSPSRGTSPSPEPLPLLGG